MGILHLLLVAQQGRGGPRGCRDVSSGRRRSAPKVEFVRRAAFRNP